MSEATQAETMAKAVMALHIDGLNNRDEQKIADSLHFPHYRLAEGQLKIWETSDDYFTDFKRRAGKAWGYTKWGQLEAIDISPNKVHFNVKVERYDQNDQLLVSFHSVWVIAKVNGRWAAQLRSSFAPDNQIIASDH